MAHCILFPIWYIFEIIFQTNITQHSFSSSTPELNERQQIQFKFYNMK